MKLTLEKVTTANQEEVISFLSKNENTSVF